MSAPFRYLIIMICLGLITFSSAFAFTPNNRLLNTLYERIDAVYSTTPERVLRAYHQLPYARILAAKNPELAYYLEKLELYLHGKLFTFTEQPNFVCFANYVQKNDTVEIDYTIKQPDGVLITTTLESVAREMGVPVSQIEQRLVFNPGNNNVMPGMDQLVLGAELNKPTTALLDPKDAYGIYKESKRIHFSGNLAPEIQISEAGERVMMQVVVEDETYLLLGTIIEKTQNSALVDFNHPRAGQTVLLSLEVMNLFKACGR